MALKQKSSKCIEKKFPDYFNRFTLPEGAHEESIIVYRACKSGKCDKVSFTPSFEENYMVKNPLIDENDPGNYSLSTYEKPKDVKRFTRMTSDFSVPYTIAIGITHPRHGLVQRTKERTGGKSSHVDWWLYKDAAPHEEFKIIENFDQYLEDYKKRRG